MENENNNSKDRLHDVFFYGLYMDPDILKQKGVNSRNPRRALVEGYVLKIGKRAALLRAPGKSSHGMVYSLTHSELQALYSGAELKDYRMEAVLAKTSEKDVVALCCNLLDPDEASEPNLEYADKLKQVMAKLGVPLTFA